MSDRKSLIVDMLTVSTYAVFLYGVVWIVSHPDDIKQFRMRYLKQMEAKSMKNAQFWADRAAGYSKAYETIKL
jgi:hypothetical protein